MDRTRSSAPQPRRQILRAAAALLAAAGGLQLSGCASPVARFVSSPPPGPEDEAPLPLTVGDQIEVDYYPTARVTQGAYRIGVDDRLRIDVVDHPALSREQLLVLPDGTISTPETGRLPAAGQTVEELAQAVAAALRRAFVRDPRVAVAVQQGDARLRSLVNRRGGIGGTDQNVFQIAETGDLALPFIAPVPALRPIEAVRADVIQAYGREFGDRLEVTIKLRQARPRQVFVMGEVSKPGPVEFNQALGPLAAVAAAGGLLATGDGASVVLYRRRAEGRHSAWMVDLRGPMTQGAPAQPMLALRPDDVIYVPKSGVAVANEMVEQYIRRMLPLPSNIGVNVNAR